MGRKLEEILDTTKFTATPIRDIGPDAAQEIRSKEHLKAFLQLGEGHKAFLFEANGGKAISGTEIDKLSLNNAWKLKIATAELADKYEKDATKRYFKSFVGTDRADILYKANGDKKITEAQIDELNSSQIIDLHDNVSRILGYVDLPGAGTTILIYEKALKLGEISSERKIANVEATIAPTSYGISAPTKMQPIPFGKSNDMALEVGQALNNLGFHHRGADYLALSDGKNGACFSLTPDSYQKFKEKYNPQEGQPVQTHNVFSAPQLSR